MFSFVADIASNSLQNITWFNGQVVSATGESLELSQVKTGTGCKTCWIQSEFIGLNNIIPVAVAPDQVVSPKNGH